MIPARVWNHPVRVDSTWMRPLLTGLLDRMDSTRCVVEFLGDARREYALAKFLRQARCIDSLIPLRWLSFYPLPQNEHTGAYRLRKTEGFQIGRASCREKV